MVRPLRRRTVPNIEYRRWRRVGEGGGGAGGCGDTMRDEEELESEVTVTRDSNPLSSVSEWKLLGDILLR